MKYRFVLLAVLLFAGVRSSGDEVGIRGRVVDGDKVAVVGAKVELRTWLGSLTDKMQAAVGEPSAVTRTDSRGFFGFEASAGGSYLIQVHARGHVPMEIHLAHLFDDIELRTVELVPASSSEIRVVSRDGSPLAGVRLKLAQFHGVVEYWRSTARRAITDATGRAVLEVADLRDARSGAAPIAAFLPGYAPARSKKPGAQIVTLELTRGVARIIEVREESGKPVAGAYVRVGRDLWPAGTTGDDGRLVLYPAAAEDLRVTVETATGAWGTQRIAAPGVGEKDPVVIEVQEPTTISGQVSDAVSEKPLAGARVWLERDPSRFVDSGQDGSYSLSSPSSNRRFARPRATATGYLRDFESTGNLRMGHRQDLALQPAVQWIGRVVDEAGGVIADAEVSATALRQSRGRGFTRSRADGSFQLAAARGVLYSLEVSRPGYLKERREAAAHDSNQQSSTREQEALEIVLKSGLAGLGRVVDRDDLPVAGADIELAVPEARHRFRYFRDHGAVRHRATTGPEGWFEVRNLAPGRLDLRVTASGYAAAEVQGVAVAPDEEGRVDLGTVVLEPGVRLEGRVLDPDGQPLAEAVVKWVPLRTGFARGFSASLGMPGVTSDSTGRFEIVDLARGEKLTLEAGREGYSKGQVVGVEIPAGEPVVLVLEPKAKIRGVVVDSLGEPVAEATVVVTHESAGGGSSSISRQSDTDGGFEFEVDASENLKLSAVSAEFRSTDRWIEIVPGEHVDDVRLVLEPGAVVDGQVVGPDGEPIAGAAVSAYGRQISSFSQHDREVTGDDGRFRLEGLETGVLAIEVHAKGFPPANRQLEVEPGTNRVEIRLAQTHDVKGRVVDGALTPVGGAQVYLNGSSGHGNAVSDADGAFVMPVPEGSYKLRAGKAGSFAWTELDEEIEVLGGPVEGLEIQLDKGAVITGRVLGLATELLPEVYVGISRVGGGQVDREGLYRIEHVAAGEWTVVAMLGRDGRTATSEAVVGSGDGEVVLDLEFSESEGLTLSGRVVIDGEPASATMVEAQGPGPDSRGRPGSLRQGGMTNYRGEFTIVDLEPGSYRLQVRKDESIHRQDLELTADHQIEIELRTHELSGHVVDATTGEPLQGADVELEPEGGESLPARSSPRLRTDSRGFFRFARTVEGGYRLRVSRSGYGPLNQLIRVEPGADLEDLELRLSPTEGLTLKVRLASGAAVRSVGVAAYDSVGELVLNQEFVVTDGGIARLSSLPAGSWVLLVAGRRSGVVQLAVEAPGEPVPVVLPAGTRLEVNVPDLVDSGETGSLSITGADGSPFLAMYSGSALPVREWTVLDGRTTVLGVPPGSWNLKVTTAGGQFWERQVVATKAGGTVQLAIE